MRVFPLRAAPRKLAALATIISSRVESSWTPVRCDRPLSVLSVWFLHALRHRRHKAGVVRAEYFNRRSPALSCCTQSVM